MQKPKLVYSRTEKLLQDTEPEYYIEIWKKVDVLPRCRTNLYSKRHHREMQFERITRDSVAESLESIGARDCIYNVSEETRRENFDRDSEDSDIDNSQSKRWRGG
jgi:hypothetical protein